MDANLTGRDRVTAAYKGTFADCVPAYPIAGSFAGCLDGLRTACRFVVPAAAPRRDEGEKRDKREGKLEQLSPHPSLLSVRPPPRRTAREYPAGWTFRQPWG